MTKIEWMELLQANLAGGDAPDDVRGQYHLADVAAYLDIAFATLVTEKSHRFQEIEDWKLDAVTKSYCEKLVCDEKSKKWYLKLPVATLNLFQNAQIRQVNAVEDTSFIFNPRAITANWVYNTLRTSEISGDPTYTLEHDRLYFDWKPENIEQLMVKLAIRFREFEDTDEINYPSGKEFMIFELVHRALSNIDNEDTVQDSNQTRP